MIDRTKIKAGSIWEAARTPPEMECKETTWIIDKVIPRGSVTEIFGQQSVGKSTLLSQLAVDLASGNMTVFDDPATWTGRPQMQVAYIDMEESDSYITNPRLLKMIGMDNENLVTFTKDHPAVAGLTTTSDAMRELCEGTEGFRPDVIFIAPISAILTDKCNATRKKDVVKALLPLVTLAEKYDCAIVFLQHTNKSKDIDYRKCISDSSYFSEAPRSILMMGELPNDQVFCSLEKSSLNRKKDKFPTRILEFRDDIQRLELVDTTPKRWREFYLEQTGKDIAEINTATSRAQKKTALAETKRVILDVLDGSGATERKELMQISLSNGATSGTFDRAIRELKDAGEIFADTEYHGQSKTTTYRLPTETNIDAEIREVFAEGGAV